jgi:photosystem II stability/assembly factor-like uncharacterized protein
MDGNLIAAPGATVSGRARQLSGTWFLAITHDGGKTWSSSSTPGNLTGMTQLTCTDSSQCLAFARTGTAQSATGFPTEMIVSSDGGATWTEKPTNLVLNGTSSPGRLVCGGQEHCLLFSVVPGMMQSWDGGGTWIPARLTPFKPGGRVGVVAAGCASAQFCVAAGLEADGPGPATPVLIVTRDGGSSWKVEPLPVPQTLP